MISILSTNGNVINYAGLSTDTKPTTDLATGSFFLEVNTSKAFFFDEASGNWIEAGGASNE